MVDYAFNFVTLSPALTFQVELETYLLIRDKRPTGFFVRAPPLFSRRWNIFCPAAIILMSAVSFYSLAR